MSQIEVDKIIPQSGTSTQLGESGDTITIPAGATITNNGTANGFGSADTEKVKVSSNDTTAGFLNGKLVAGTNISLTEGSDGGNETLTAALTGTIATAQIADNAITLAKMASGTDGNIISYDASGNPVAVATGSAGQILTSAGAGAPPTFAAAPAGGITGADFWRLNADVKFGTGIQIIDSNWERVDGDNYGVIGSAMSQSSGVFTFPTTGIWHIQYYVNLFCDAGEILRFDNRIQTTTNNSSYDVAAFSHISTKTDNFRQSTTLSFIVDCQNTSTNKLRFTYYDFNNTDSTLVGDTNATGTGASFIRLGDT